MGITVDGKTTTDFFALTYESLAQANANRFRRVKVEDVEFIHPQTGDLPSGIAVHCQRPWRGKFERLKIDGPYVVGVKLVFALNAKLIDVVVDGASTGYWIGSGVGTWEGAEHNNSASNLVRVQSCRFGGRSDLDVGFVLSGGGNVVLDQTTVEGLRCGVGWKLFPRSPRCTTTFSNAWLEVEVATAIQWDGYYSTLVIQSLNLVKEPKQYLIDTLGDQYSTVIFRDNNWRRVPPCRFDPTTTVIVEGNNNFSCEQFWKDSKRGGA